MRLFALALALGLTITAVPALADSPSVNLGGGWNLGISAQYRPRVTAHTGLDLVDENRTTRHHFDQRARLGISLGYESGLKLLVQLQDVRTWGEEADTLNDYSANGFDLHQAFGIVPIGFGLSLKIGRQEIIFDNHRLVGNVGWSQRARAFDAARLNYKRGDIDLSVIYARVLEDDASGGGHVSDADGHVPAGRGDDTHAVMARLGWSPMSELKGSLTYVGTIDEAKEHTRHTMGLYLHGAWNGLSYSGEFYYQMGSLKNAAGEEKDIGAMLGAASVGYTAPVTTSPFIKAWGEFISGDKTPESTFATPYPTNHKFYGELDYFLNTVAHTANLGLLDVGGRVGLKPADWFKFHVDFHHFRSVEDDPNGNGDFGNEIDVKLIFNVVKFVQFRLFYGVFLPGEAIRTPRSILTGTDLQTEHLFYFTTDIKI